MANSDEEEREAPGVKPDGRAEPDQSLLMRSLPIARILRCIPAAAAATWRVLVAFEEQQRGVAPI